MSQNNPHLAAYDCGACSGRHGGPNARAFAAMANRPVVRALLGERGIHIPSDTWFLGAEHNTCDERIVWFDLDVLPDSHRSDFEELANAIIHACTMSAHERCRRFASAPSAPTLGRALEHVRERAADFSQARPELGHATDAVAFVGRRAATQGVFFDRRMFLISYDATQDPEGRVLENLLLAAGPVGAGINLEYYFSSVNADRFGCGTKVVHNVVGMCAVMEGTASDLRTGLPRQMTEVHEAMRLQIVVEAELSVLERVYESQPSLRELIGNRWVHLSALHPETGAIHVFDPARGFVAWTPYAQPLSEVSDSPRCYGTRTGPLPPVLIRQPRPAA